MKLPPYFGVNSLAVGFYAVMSILLLDVQLQVYTGHQSNTHAPNWHPLHTLEYHPEKLTLRLPPIPAWYIMARQLGWFKTLLIESITMQTSYWFTGKKILTPDLVVSVTCWSRVWQRTKSTKNRYILKDSVHIMLVTNIIVLRINSEYLP